MNDSFTFRVVFFLVNMEIYSIVILFFPVLGFVSTEQGCILYLIFLSVISNKLNFRISWAGIPIDSIFVLESVNFFDNNPETG